MIESLLETIRVELLGNEAYVFNFDSHYQRLLFSMNCLKFKNRNDLYLLLMNQIKNTVQYQLRSTVKFINEPKSLSGARFKLKLIYQANADFDITLVPYQRDFNKIWQIKISNDFCIDHKDLKWRHKFYPRNQLDYQNCDEVIWLNDLGQVCEGSITNIFFLDKNNHWHTPCLESNILAGTTRITLINDLKAKEGFYYKEDLIKAKEILLSNSMIICQKANLL
jgi:branched-subunit amino acid aminotransferase/4-amino-4-deoxychorismate lyase